MTLRLADQVSTGPTLNDARMHLHAACRRPSSEKPTEFYLDLFTRVCGIPTAHLDAWMPMAQRWFGPGGLDNHTSEEKTDPRSIYLSVLLAWLQMAADAKNIDTTMTVADATGWQLVLAGAWINDENIQLVDLVNPWHGMTHTGWAYAAAGFTPTDIQTAHSERLPDPDGLRVMAALRGVVLPNPLSDRTGS